MNAGLMSGKRGLIMGVANDHSIAWGIAKRLAEQGAELAFTYQPPNLDKRVRPLAKSVGSESSFPAMSASLPMRPNRRARPRLRRIRPALDLPRFRRPRHCLLRQGGAEGPLRRDDPRQLQEDDGDLLLLLHRDGKRAAKLMTNGGGAMLTLTYGGSTRVMPNYNVMGVAKAALEASVRYLAYDFGDRNIRVNAISAGPVRTLAGSGVADARLMFNYQKKNAPLRRSVSIEEIGNTALYLLSDLGSAVTGEIHFVDAGYSIVSMPRLDELKELDTTEPANQAAE